MSPPLPALPRLGRHNPRLVRLRRLGRGDEPALTVVDGAKLVVELAERGADLIELFVVPQRVPSVLAHPVVRALAEKGAVFEIDSDAASRIAPTRTSQGVLGVVRVPCPEIAPQGVAVFLDHVQDPGNVGAVVRSAAALGATGVYCSPASGDPFSPKAVRGSAGLSLLFPVTRHTPFAEAAERFRAAGGEIAAAVGSGGTPASAWRPHRPLLLALGNEGTGLDDAIVRGADTLVTIPMSEGVESLNVAVTAGILLAGLRGVVPSPILE